MTVSQETSAAQDIFKRRYVDGVTSQLPEFAILQDAIKFDAENKTGDRYEAAVMLRYPNGATYQSGSNRATVYSFNDPRAGSTQRAYVSPMEYHLREQVAHGLISAAASSEQAFTRGMDVIVMGMKEATDFHLETCLMYGGTSLGAFNAALGGSYTAATGVISKASWAAALWAAAEGMEVDAYDSTLVTKRNTNGPIIISSVATDTRTLTMAFSANADFVATGSGDVLVPVGANGQWMDGLASLVSKSIAGTTTLGISPATYGSWKANTFDAGGAGLTFTKVTQAASSIASRGGLGDFTVLVSPWTWTDINIAEAALRNYTTGYGGEFENGASSLKFHGPNGGFLEIKQHPLVKAGEAYIVNFNDFKRVGDSEPTFNLPGSSVENPMFFQQVPGKSGFEVQRYFSQALFCNRMNRVGRITNIVNGSL